jgi:hypothetical protein
VSSLRSAAALTSASHASACFSEYLRTF